LIKKDWIENTKCIFCDDEEFTSHLFVTCPLVKQIWQWIAKYNNFLFEGNTLSDLWLVNYCIPLKNKFVTELLRGAVLWTIWLERNKLVLTDKKTSSIVMLGRKIINLTHYWCLQKGKVDLLKLSLILPHEVDDLIMQVQVWSEEEMELVEKDSVEIVEVHLAILPSALNITLTSGREGD
jgi:hypothetical protein